VKIAPLPPTFLCLFAFAGCCTSPQTLTVAESTVVEAACGECKFGMKGDDCDLAIRINGRSYFVDGVNPDTLGDAHAADGICESVRQARVTGAVRNGRFAATSFELLPAATR
jgi:hypothetical protein